MTLEARNVVGDILKDDTVLQTTKDLLRKTLVSFIPTDPVLLQLQTTIKNPTTDASTLDKAIQDLVLKYREPEVEEVGVPDPNALPEV